MPKNKTKLYGDRSIAARAPRLWNSQPVDIKNSESLNSFSAKECRDHIIVEYRDHYSHYYYV